VDIQAAHLFQKNRVRIMTVVAGEYAGNSPISETYGWRYGCNHRWIYWQFTCIRNSFRRIHRPFACIRNIGLEIAV
jgi:hypothetical protein